jgi:hypothetical protein
MKFHLTEPTDGYAIRYESEGGRWECGIHQNDLDLRYWIGAGLVGEQCYEITYCCESITSTSLYALALLMGVLERLPEEINVSAVRDFFPDRKAENWIVQLKDTLETLTQVGNAVKERNQ